jgi:hypothetical protein
MPALPLSQGAVLEILVNHAGNDERHGTAHTKQPRQ